MFKITWLRVQNGNHLDSDEIRCRYGIGWVVMNALLDEAKLQYFAIKRWHKDLQFFFLTYFFPRFHIYGAYLKETIPIYRYIHYWRWELSCKTFACFNQLLLLLIFFFSEAALINQIRSSPRKCPGCTIFHARSRSEPASVTKQANQLLTPKKKVLSPFRERFCSDSSVELSPRRAFQEM